MYRCGVAIGRHQFFSYGREKPFGSGSHSCGLPFVNLRSGTQMTLIGSTSQTAARLTADDHFLPAANS